MAMNCFYLWGWGSVVRDGISQYSDVMAWCGGME